MNRLPRRAPCWFFAAALLPLAVATPVAGSDALVVLSADSEGQARPCSSCPGGEVGGFARRQTLLNALRKGSRPLLVLDAGNSLYGGNDPSLPERALVSLHDRLGYDVLNIGYRDFRQGRAPTVGLLKDAPFVAVSANLAAQEDGALLFPPFHVEEVGGSRIAVIGVTEAPPHLESLPHLAEQLRGITIRPPLEALKTHLPQLEKIADQVLLLYYGSPRGLEEIVATFGPRLAWIGAGGFSPSHLPESLQSKVAVVHPQGAELATVSGLGAELTIAPLPVNAGVPPDPTLTEYLEGWGGSTPTEPGETVRAARWTGENRALALGVLGVERLEADGYLALETRWENRMPLDLVAELEYPERGSIADLRRQAFLLVDDRVVLRLVAGAEKLPGHLPAKFALELGEVREGRLVFPLQACGPQSRLELIFYTQTFAPIRIPLQELPPEEASETTIAVEPPHGLGRNEVVELGVFGFEKTPRRGKEEAPPGTTFVVCDVRARSLLEKETDARALDANASPRARAKLPLVVEYGEAPALLQLLVDGEQAYTRLQQNSTLEAEPPFLPTPLAGGEAVFLIPADARSLELVACFPAMQLTTGRDLGTPETLRFPLAGEAPPPSTEALVRVDDDPLPFEVLGSERLARLGEFSAGESNELLVVSCAVRNNGEEGGLYEVKNRLRVAGVNGESVARAVTDRIGLGLEQPFWLPPGERRLFRVIFDVPRDGGGAEISYRGVSQAARFTLGAAATAPVVEPVVEPAVAAPKITAPKIAAPKITEAPPVAVPVTPSATATPRQPRGLAGVGLTAQQVNDAIDRGSEFLWRTLQEELKGDLGSFPGRPDHTIAALALIHCGAHRKYPQLDLALQRWFGELLDRHTASPKARYVSGRTYPTAVYAMAIDAYDDPTFFPVLAHLSQTLVDGQGSGGTWTYTLPWQQQSVGAAAKEAPLFTVLEGGDTGSEIIRTTEWEDVNGDNSVGQFAILGLRAAHRRGVNVSKDTWSRAREAFHGRQGKDGGWAYTQSGSSYGSMTCAGVCSLLLARWALGEQSPAASAEIERGLSWLADNFSSVRNPKHQIHTFYYLYSLERVGRLFNTEFLGEHEWYPLGARSLVGWQKDDGGWEEQGQRTAPTSFALLFLTRATESLTPGKASGPGLLRTSLKTAVAPRYYLILDASGSMLARLGERNKFDVARETLLGLIDELPDEASVALRVYGHRKAATEDGAAEDTELVLRMKTLDRKHRDALAEAIRSLRPRGRTPLGLSLRKSLEDLRRLRLTAWQQTRVVLLSDGGDDTRSDIDPLQSVESFGKLQNVGLIVIGFDVDDQRGAQQLQKIAAVAKGSHLTPRDEQTLARSLRRAFGQINDAFVVENAAAEVVGSGRLGDTIELPAGSYRLVAAPFGTQRVSGFRIRPAATTAVVCNAEKLPVLEAEAPPAASGKRGNFCTGCGAKLAAKGNFCTGCGKRIAR